VPLARVLTVMVGIPAANMLPIEFLGWLKTSCRPIDEPNVALACERLVCRPSNEA
jgi:hypothetical protein